MNTFGAESGLTLETLTLPKEKTYGKLVILFSILAWIIVVISIVGIFYGALFALFGWMGNGLLNARLRSESVEVTERQLPELHQTFLAVCAKLGLTEIPRLYVVQSGGVLNAFASRFTGRNFVVVYSSMLDSLGPSSPEMQFILGHEIGHVRSNHVLKKLFCAPGIIVPLLGPAYLRACEASCDRHGAFVADDLNGAVRAMLVLSGGSGHGPQLDPKAFAQQHAAERGFFVSLHELVSGYPTLSQRTANLLALSNPEFPETAPRNPLAYFFAIFTPGGTQGSTNTLVLIVIIGLLAAMAIPAFAKVRQQSAAKACQRNEQAIAAAFENYVTTTGRMPTQLSDFIGPGKTLTAMPACPTGGTYSVKIGANREPIVTCSQHGYLVNTSPQPSS